MITTKSLIIIIIATIMWSCKNKKYETSCMENPGNGKFFVFVGEKIDVKDLLDENNIIDAKFLARYKILEKVCGDYNKDTIEFIVYDHYGRPRFEEHKTVLLYVSEHNGKYYHEKYQYNDIYQTKKGEWASPYSTYDYDDLDSTKYSIKPEKIEFVNEVTYDISGWKKQKIKSLYPEPFYKIVGNRAIAVYGNYIPELFELKKRGVFNARGLFGNQENTKELEPKEIELAPIPVDIKITKQEQNQFNEIWKQFFNALKNKDLQTIKYLSADSVVCSVCEGFSEPYFYNDIEPVDTFLTYSHKNFPNTQLWNIMKDGKYELSALKYTNNDNSTTKDDEVLYRIKFSTKAQFDRTIYHLDHFFEFIKRDDNFKFTGMESSWSTAEHLD